MNWGIAPALGLSQAKRVRLLDRSALATDHLLHGSLTSHAQTHVWDARARLSAAPRTSALLLLH